MCNNTLSLQEYCFWTLNTRSFKNSALFLEKKLRTLLAQFYTRYHLYKNLFKLTWKSLDSYTRFTVLAMNSKIWRSDPIIISIFSAVLIGFLYQFSSLPTCLTPFYAPSITQLLFLWTKRFFETFLRFFHTLKRQQIICSSCLKSRARSYELRSVLIKRYPLPL